MRIDIEHLIKKVQEEHKTMLRADDPIFVSVTLNRIVLEKLLSEVNDKLELAFAHIAAGTREQGAIQIDAAKRVASEIISEVPNYIRSELAKMIPGISSDVMNKLSQLGNNLNHSLEAMHSLRRSAWIAVVLAAGLAGISIGISIAMISFS